jgi:hypothetical protein
MQDADLINVHGDLLTMNPVRISCFDSHFTSFGNLEIKSEIQSSAVVCVTAW